MASRHFRGAGFFQFRALLQRPARNEDHFQSRFPVASDDDRAELFSSPQGKGKTFFLEKSGFRVRMAFGPLDRDTFERAAGARDTDAFYVWKIHGILGHG